MIVMSKSAYPNYDGEIRRKEAEAAEERTAAARKLGVESIEVLDFPKDIPYDPNSVEALDRLLDERRPELVITPLAAGHTRPPRWKYIHRSSLTMPGTELGSSRLTLDDLIGQVVSGQRSKK